jgi:hypothetical protein
MRNKAGLIVPVAMMLFGIYALFVTLSSGGEQVALISDHQIPRGLAIVFGLLGLGGGAFVMFTALSIRKHASQRAREGQE